MSLGLLRIEFFLLICSESDLFKSHKKDAKSEIQRVEKRLSSRRKKKKETRITFLAFNLIRNELSFGRYKKKGQVSSTVKDVADRLFLTIKGWKSLPLSVVETNTLNKFGLNSLKYMLDFKGFIDKR
ncbi:hypothetical protein BpHYR1_018397 [Brachionus plicatilis]|uniref:RNA-directed DNA polymerase from mobile element jockey-like n=1 Tax=Brachionus plicatilis TaxID=10195 RepID=A0A3M7P6M3_BRAPC|nr:hypothetical protein BpHYR1_018397 [Brachionus plicatilis]